MSSELQVQHSLGIARAKVVIVWTLNYYHDVTVDMSLSLLAEESD
jgi:hypothetical protein